MNAIRGKGKPLPALRTVKIGASTKVYYDSVLMAAGIDPATEPADRPITITIKDTQRRLSCGAMTVWRMIKRGRELEAAASQR